MYQEKIQFIAECKEKSKDDGDCSDHSDTETNTSKDESIIPEFLEEVSSVLISIINQNRQIPYDKNKTDKAFSHPSPPKISILDYLSRIQKYLNLNNSTFIIALIYIDRVCKKNSIALTKYNIHRFLLSAILIAIKYNEDIIYENSYYSRVVGITTKELGKLENKFIQLIGFKLFVTDELFQKYISLFFSYNKLTNI